MREKNGNKTAKQAASSKQQKIAYCLKLSSKNYN
jgi:hypothetical protein